MFDLRQIESETQFRRIDYHKELASTNDQAIQLARGADLPGAALVLAERQTAGRGRGAKVWWSGEGALTFSAILSEQIEALPSDRTPQLALAAGLAVSESLREFAPELDLGVKWPNDVYVAGRKKISGILIEMPPTKIRTAVIGIGINANNSFRTAPAELQSKATSLVDELERPLELTNILISTLQRLTALTATLCERPAEILSRWRDLCVLTGKTVCVTNGRSTTRGACQGVNDHGALIVLTADGPVACSAGTVSDFA